MTSPAEGLKAIATTAGLIGGITGWTGNVGGLSTSTTAKEVSFLDSGGRAGEVKVAIDYPTVQVLVRGSKAAGGYSEAYQKAQAVYDALVGITTPNGIWARLVSCVPRGFINWLGRDDQDRPQFSLNFQLITTPESQGNRTY